MLIYYDTATNHIETFARVNDENHIHNRRLLSSMGCEFALKLDENIMIYINDQFESRVEKLKNIFKYVENRNKKNLPIYVVISNRYEPRDYRISNTYNFIKNRTNVKIENIILLTGSTIADRGAENKIRIFKFPNDGMNFFKMTVPDLKFNFKETEKEKLVSSFNRRLNKQRMIQTAKLLNEFNDNEIMVSLGVGHDTVEKNIRNEFYSLTTKDYELPIMIDLDYLSLEDERQYDVEVGDSSKCLFNIVNETIPTSSMINEVNYGHDSALYATEKSYRPFLNSQIPIYNSTVGFSKWLESYYGFDLFKDIIDYSKWDNVYNVIHRSDIIVNELKKFKNKYKDYNKFFKEHKHRFEKNFNIVSSMTDTDKFIKKNENIRTKNII